MFQYCINLLCVYSLILCSCSGNTESIQYADLLGEAPYLEGTWSGFGTFNDVKHRANLDSVYIELVIAGHAIHALIGDAQLENIQVNTKDFGYIFSGTLNKTTVNGIDLGKKYGSILFVLPETGRDKARHSNANFHLSKNRNFDINLIVGGMVLYKKPTIEILQAD